MLALGWSVLLRGGMQLSDSISLVLELVFVLICSDWWCDWFDLCFSDVLVDCESIFGVNRIMCRGMAVVSVLRKLS
ncbi:MAG: hypothetical protein EBS77_09005 [Gammaproteobacteria bacterium]|nr:hypothetical protein [Gammaproteobacteria bacterium]